MVEVEEAKQEAKNLLDVVKEILPKEAGLVKVEFEGPDVAIYVKNVAAIYGNEQVIRSVSATIKKKLIVRSDASGLKDPEETRAKILEIVPKEAGISEETIRFVS